MPSRFQRRLARIARARWFLVNAGQTLFLPANLTHKVITLEPYVGVGGFYIALPNCLRLLAHWINRVPLWSKRDTTGRNDELIGEIAKSVRETILALRDATPEKRQMLGYDYLEESARSFLGTCSSARLRFLWSDPRFRCVAEVIPAPWPLSSGASCDCALIAKETTGQGFDHVEAQAKFSLTFPNSL